MRDPSFEKHVFCRIFLGELISGEIAVTDIDIEKMFLLGNDLVSVTETELQLRRVRLERNELEEYKSTMST